MKHYILSIILASFFFAGCATTQTSGQLDVQSIPEAKEARAYQADGQYEAAVEAYKKLIAANPKHFKSVLYQHEIMAITESFSEPNRLIDETKNTLKLFDTAQKESFEGATPEAIQQEHEALQEYIYRMGNIFHLVYQKTHNEVYSSYAEEFYKIYMDHFSESKSTCDAMYYYADILYFTKDYENAAIYYEKVLNECDNETLQDYPRTYSDAAHGAVLAYDELMGSDSCPKSPVMPGYGEYEEYPEYPIAECRLKFIEASQRYYEINQKYYPDEQNEFPINAQYKSALIYFNHNQFDKAKPIFEEVINKAPQSEAAVYACHYILETYRLRIKIIKNYQEMLDYIRKVKNNQEFMKNSTTMMYEFVIMINEYEAALVEIISKEGAE